MKRKIMSEDIHFSADKETRQMLNDLVEASDYDSLSAYMRHTILEKYRELDRQRESESNEKK